MGKETIIYINTTAVRSGLPDGLVYWILPWCREVGVTRRFISFHGGARSVYPTVYELPRVVRLVSSNGYILFPRP